MSRCMAITKKDEQCNNKQNPETAPYCKLHRSYKAESSTSVKLVPEVQLKTNVEIKKKCIEHTEGTLGEKHAKYCSSHKDQKSCKDTGACNWNSVSGKCIKASGKEVVSKINKLDTSAKIIGHAYESYKIYNAYKKSRSLKKSNPKALEVYSDDDEDDEDDEDDDDDLPSELLISDYYQEDYETPYESEHKLYCFNQQNESDCLKTGVCDYVNRTCVQSLDNDKRKKYITNIFCD